MLNKLLSHEYIGYFVRTPIGFILLIVIPATLIIIMEIRNIIKEVKKTKQGGKAVEKVGA